MRVEKFKRLRVKRSVFRGRVRRGNYLTFQLLNSSTYKSDLINFSTHKLINLKQSFAQAAGVEPVNVLFRRENRWHHQAGLFRVCADGAPPAYYPFAAYPFSGLSPAGWLPLSVADYGSLMMAGGKAKTKTK